MVRVRVWLGLGCGGVCKGDYVCYFTVLLMLCNVMSRIRDNTKTLRVLFTLNTNSNLSLVRLLSRLQ